MSAQSNRINVNLTKLSALAMGSIVSSNTIHKIVLGATIDGISRHDVTDLSNG